MPATYEPIATTTLGSAAADITFSSISASYTDLRVVLVATANSGSQRIHWRFNSDTGSNYSNTILLGDGASATSVRSTSQTSIRSANANTLSTNPSVTIIDIFSYAGSTNKTCLIASSSDQNGSGNVARTVGLWRNTTTITSVSASPEFGGGDFAAGTTATLYGILKA